MESREQIRRAASTTDERGVFLLTLGTDRGDHQFEVADAASARELLRAVSRLRPWIEQHPTVIGGLLRIPEEGER